MNQALNRGQKEATIQLTDCIVISPYAAKRLSMLFGGLVKKCESRFDTLRRSRRRRGKTAGRAAGNCRETL